MICLSPQVGPLLLLPPPSLLLVPTPHNQTSPSSLLPGKVRRTCTHVAYCLLVALNLSRLSIIKSHLSVKK